jgi:hypothetical protein
VSAGKQLTGVLNALRTSATSGTAHPATDRHIQKEMDLLQFHFVILLVTFCDNEILG